MQRPTAKSAEADGHCATPTPWLHSLHEQLHGPLRTLDFTGDRKPLVGLSENLSIHNCDPINLVISRTRSPWKGRQMVSSVYMFLLGLPAEEAVTGNVRTFQILWALREC